MKRNMIHLNLIFGRHVIADYLRTDWRLHFSKEPRLTEEEIFAATAHIPYLLRPYISRWDMNRLLRSIRRWIKRRREWLDTHPEQP